MFRWPLKNWTTSASHSRNQAGMFLHYSVDVVDLRFTNGQRSDDWRARHLQRYEQQPCMCHRMVLKLAWKDVDHFWSIHQAKKKQKKTAGQHDPSALITASLEYHMMTHTGLLVMLMRMPCWGRKFVLVLIQVFASHVCGRRAAYEILLSFGAGFRLKSENSPPSIGKISLRNGMYERWSNRSFQRRWVFGMPFQRSLAKTEWDLLNRMLEILVGHNVKWQLFFVKLLNRNKLSC